MMARFVGTLSFENGCILVDGAPYIFPADVTTWDGTTLTVNGHTFVVGDEIIGGGGEWRDLELSDEIRDHCGDLPPWLVSGVEPEG